MKRKESEAWITIQRNRGKKTNGAGEGGGSQTGSRDRDNESAPLVDPVLQSVMRDTCTLLWFN